MSLQAAEQFEANEQYEQAYNEYLKEYERNNSDTGILERLGHLALILEKPQDAAIYYQEILTKDAANALAYEQLMSIFENTDKFKYYVYRGNKNSLEGKLDFAINDFKKALSNAPDDAQAVIIRLTLANIYRQQGHTMKAIDEFNYILEYDNLNEDIFLQLADLYMQDEAYSSAVETLMRAKQNGFDNDRINEGIAVVYLKSGNPEKSLEFTKDDLTKIRCLLELQRVDEAYSILNSLPEELKSRPEFYTLEAQYYYASKDFDKSLEAIDQFDKLAPNSPLTYQMRALVYEEKNDDYNAHLNWGKYNILRKNNDIAINEFLNAVQYKSDDVGLLFTLASLLEENGEVNHAAEYYERIVQIQPDNVEALRKLASFREGIGDYRKQIEYLEKIVELSSTDAKSIKELARVYEKNHENSKAVGMYSKYLDLIKDASEYKLIKDKIEKLESNGLTSDNSEGLIDKIMGFFNKK